MIVAYVAAMTVEVPTPRDLEIMAVDAGISMTEACKRAKMSPAVFHRWKAKRAAASIENVRSLVDVLRDAINGRKADP